MSLKTLDTLVENILNENIQDLRKSDLDMIKNNIEDVSKIYFPILETEINNLIKKRKETNHKALYWSMKLAAYCEDKNAFFLILKILKLPVNIIDEFLKEQFIDEDLKYIIAYTVNEWEKLKKVIEDTHIDEFIRKSCLDALVIMFFREKINRKDIINYFKSYLNKIIDEKVNDDEIATFMVNSCVDLYPIECFEEIKELFGLDLIDQTYIDIDEIYQTFNTSKDKYLNENKNYFLNYDFFQYVPKEEIENSEKFFDDLKELFKKVDKQIEDQISLKEEKTNRNDKCSCGSGKKYKKCCLNKSDQTNQRIEEFDVTYDPYQDPKYENIPNKEKERLDKLYFLLEEKKPKKVLNQLKESMKKYPDIEKYYNYKYCALMQLKKPREAMKCLKETLKKFPDYLFAKIELASYFLRRGEYEKIPELFSNKFTLKGLYPERNVFHVSEFISFSYIISCYFIAINDINQAKIYLNMIKEIDPESKNVKNLTRKIKSKTFLNSLEFKKKKEINK